MLKNKVYSLKKEDYYHLGQYKCPTVYYWLCQNWANRASAKEHGLAVDGRLLILDGHLFFWRQDWEYLQTRTRDAVRTHDPQFFDKLITLSKETTEEVLDISSALREAPISREGTAAFLDAVHRMEFPWHMLVPVGEELERLIREEISKNALPENTIEAFLELPQPTFLMQQKKAAEKISTELEQAGLLDTVRSGEIAHAVTHLKESAPDLFEKLEHFVREYRWYGMMHFWGSPFTIDAAIDQIRSLKSSDNSNENVVVPESLQWLKRYTGELSYWRQHLAEVCSVTSEAILESFNRSNLGMTFEEARWLTPDEMLAYIESRKLPETAWQERKNAYGLASDGEHVSLVAGSELQNLLEDFLPKISQESEIKGMVAFRGTVRGRVKIVTSPDQIGKVEKGDVLVSPETTPDFVPAMQRAAAIVTDMGGVTSHAAIVSREFKTPCIVGTQIATRVLKDGDMVEVDAEKGVVRKLGGDT